MGLIGPLLVSLALTIVMIPILNRIAPHVGLVDVPDGARKVHTHIIARCGGIGLGAGALAGMLLLNDAGPELLGYVGAALVILVFGVWDDIANLNYRWKFAGQMLATAVVMATGTVLVDLPLIGTAPAWLSYPFTFLLLLGVTNAVNLVDGLDGLAGGCALLSLAAMAMLGQSDPASAVPLVAVALIGAILGFLRFNTWPAMIFMGDAGSQFLGFSAGVLAIWLVETDAAGLSPAMVLLLLGLPIMDTLTVMTQRILQGRSPFSPDKSHIHHKLLSLGFHHGQAVALIYLIQAGLVVMVFTLADAGDLAVVAVYAAIFAAVVGSIEWARHAGWRLRTAERAPAERRNLFLRRQRWLPRACDLTLISALALFMLAGALAPHAWSPDSSLLSGALALAALTAIVLPTPISRAIIRICAYMMIGLSGWTLGLQADALPALDQGLWTYATLVLVVLLIGVRVTRRELLSITPQDALIALIAVGALLIPQHLLGSFGRMVPIMVVNLFTVEFLLEGTRRGRLLGVAAAVCLALYALPA